MDLENQSASELFNRLFELSSKADLEALLEAMGELEENKILTLYAGTYSIEDAIQKYGEYDTARFYFYRNENKKGYVLYINPLGFGIKAEDIFSSEAKKNYTKEALSNIKTDKEDLRSGEYFKPRSKILNGVRELFSELFGEGLAFGIFFALGIGVIALLSNWIEIELDFEETVMLGIVVFLALSFLAGGFAAIFKAIKKKRRRGDSETGYERDSETDD